MCIISATQAQQIINIFSSVRLCKQCCGTFLFIAGKKISVLQSRHEAGKKTSQHRLNLRLVSLQRETGFISQSRAMRLHPTTDMDTIDAYGLDIM
jgi:hypothetical protein